MSLLEIKNVSVVYKKRGFFKTKTFQVLKEINLTIDEKESLALLGESGSGKTTLGRLIVRLLKPTEGEILFKGKNVYSLGKEYTRYVSMVFQDPAGSLNPRYTVWEAVEEPLIVHGFPKRERTQRVEKYLLWSKVDPVLWRRRTASLSGGQKQRVAIARALVLEPYLVVADEPTSALDLSVQYEIIKLFNALRESKSLLFITHDLRVAAKVSDRVALLLGGRLMEVSPTELFIKKPLHPYGEYLLKSLPASSPFERDKTPPVEEFPTLRDEGCPFRKGCPHYDSRCEQFPPPAEVEDNRKKRTVWCWIYCA
jgi:peptide/nickel transport system ATP-binding protein